MLERFKEVISKARERQAKREEVRGKKKAARKDSREAVKKVRKDYAGKENRDTRKGLVGATKAFHSTDKEGNKGGMKAFGEWSRRKKAVKDKIAERKAARKGEA